MSGANQAALVVMPHPLTHEGRRVYMPIEAPLRSRETLGEFIGRHGVMPGQQWVVCIGGVDVPEEHWSRVRPTPGHIIECRRVPQKDILRIVAFAALSYFTFGSGSIFGINSAAALGSTGLSLAQGAMALDGMFTRQSRNRSHALASPSAPARRDSAIRSTAACSQ